MIVGVVHSLVEAGVYVRPLRRVWVCVAFVCVCVVACKRVCVCVRSCAVCVLARGVCHFWVMVAAQGGFGWE